MATNGSLIFTPYSVPLSVTGGGGLAVGGQDISNIPLTANDTNSTKALGTVGGIPPSQVGNVLVNMENLAIAAESSPILLANGAGFTSLGPVKLCCRHSRAALRVALGNGALPAGGAQFQINIKETPNAPWYTAWNWASIQAISVSGPPSGDSPLYIITDQSSIIFPINSNVTFNMDVRGLWAVDVQCSLTAGAYTLMSQLFAGVKTKA